VVLFAWRIRPDRVAAIGSNKGGIPERVEHQKNGLLINPGDAESRRDVFRRATLTP
jgi:glycosyltransferase involved in cell wall biosynthesis